MVFLFIVKFYFAFSYPSIILPKKVRPGSEEPGRMFGNQPLMAACGATIHGGGIFPRDHDFGGCFPFSL